MRPLCFRRPDHHHQSENHRDAHRPRPQRRVSVESMTLKEAYSVPKHTSAICVQSFDDSLNSAIHITYRISLRSSSLREPRDPLSKVVYFLLLKNSVKLIEFVNCRACQRLSLASSMTRNTIQCTCVGEMQEAFASTASQVHC